MLSTDAFLNKSFTPARRFNSLSTKNHPTTFDLILTNISSSKRGDGMNLADDEPLSSKFQRAVVLQRAGDYTSALREYQMFMKVAESCDVSPELYAEVHVNMGAIYIKHKNISKAKESFGIALKYREIGSAYVNLALLELSEGQLSQNPADGLKALAKAEYYCKKTLGLDEDPRTIDTATRLLRDIQKMLNKI